MLFLLVIKYFRNLFVGFSYQDCVWYHTYLQVELFENVVRPRQAFVDATNYNSYTSVLLLAYKFQSLLSAR